MRNLKNKNGQWVIDYRLRGKRIRRVIGESKREAEAVLAAIKTDMIREQYGLSRPKKPEVLFEDQAKEFLELYSKQNKKSWMRDALSLKYLKEFFKDKNLSEITPDLIEKYKLERRVAGVSDATINRELACLKTLYAKAIEWQKAEANPAGKVKKFRERPLKERILRPEENNKLLETSSPELKPVLILALNTGMRKAEILNLRWDAVNFSKGFIHIEDSKSGRSRDIPLNGLAFEALKEISRKGEFVFTNDETKNHTQDVKTAFKGACRRAGIKGLRFHDLRHTAASRMIEAGVDLVTVSKILGHASIQMTMRYAHPTAESMRRAVQKLGEYFEGTGHKEDIVEIPKLATYLKSFN